MLVCLLLPVLFLTACGNDDSVPENNGREDKTLYAWTIASQTYQSGPLSAYFIKDEEGSDWKPVWSSIVGLEYEAGYEYCVVLRHFYYNDGPVADRTDDYYKVIEIISKEKKDSEDLPAFALNP